MEKNQLTDNNAILIANDHGGFDLKQSIIEFLEKRGIPYQDMGSHSTDIVRYPHYASKVAEAISKGSYQRGILICSTGIGMSIIANKYPNVRASLCTNAHMGKMTRAHNNSNILCLGGKLTEASEALDILDAWLETEFEGGRHNISLDMIGEAEKAMINEEVWISKDPHV